VQNVHITLHIALFSIPNLPTAQGRPMKMGSPYVVGRFGIAVFYIAKTRFSTQYLPHKGNHVKNVYQQD